MLQYERASTNKSILVVHRSNLFHVIGELGAGASGVFIIIQHLVLWHRENVSLLPSLLDSPFSDIIRKVGCFAYTIFHIRCLLGGSVEVWTKKVLYQLFIEGQTHFGMSRGGTIEFGLQ